MAVEHCSENRQHAIAQPYPLSLYRSIDKIHAAAFAHKDFQPHYRNPGIPVVVGGLLDDTSDWSLDSLCQVLGDYIFPIRHYGQDRYQQDKRQWTSSGSGVEARSMTFAEYANHLQTGVAKQHDLYLARCSLKGTPLEAAPALHQAEAWFGLQFPATSLNLWVGPGGHTSCLHYDPMDGILMQLYGFKKILLFPPSQTYNLYPIPVYKQIRHGLKLRAVYSQVYPENPDFQAFPKFASALPHGLEVVLHPGEILFLPAGWWHEVTALGDGVVCSVNRFWTVLPMSRALCSWNKWRAHLASVLAMPHIGWSLISAMCHQRSGDELKKLIQRL